MHDPLADRIGDRTDDHKYKALAQAIANCGKSWNSPQLRQPSNSEAILGLSLSP